MVRDFVFNFTWPFKRGTYTDAIWNDYYGRWFFWGSLAMAFIATYVFPHKGDEFPAYEESDRVKDVKKQIEEVKQKYDRTASLFSTTYK